MSGRPAIRGYGTDPAEPIITQNQSLAKPAKGVRDAEDIECILKKVRTCFYIKWTTLAMMFRTVNAQLSP